MEAPPAINPWDWIYATREISTVGWYEPQPTTSEDLVRDAIRRGGRSLIDVGGGGSWLVDQLLTSDLERIAVLDIAEAGLAIARQRLGTRADLVTWIVGDASSITDVGSYDIWHDRGGFHFLLDSPAQDRYLALLERTVPVGGTAIIATFADDGPERCSGLPIVRWEPDRLAAAIGPAFRLADSRRHTHRTPAGVEQRFQYSTLVRVGPGRGPRNRLG